MIIDCCVFKGFRQDLGDPVIGGKLRVGLVEFGICQLPKILFTNFSACAGVMRPAMLMTILSGRK
jgi:hypothetical protein